MTTDVEIFYLMSKSAPGLYLMSVKIKLIGTISLQDSPQRRTTTKIKSSHPFSLDLGYRPSVWMLGRFTSGRSVLWT
jgi:hypothetical protein